MKSSEFCESNIEMITQYWRDNRHTLAKAIDDIFILHFPDICFYLEVLVHHLICVYIF